MYFVDIGIFFCPVSHGRHDSPWKDDFVKNASVWLNDWQHQKIVYLVSLNDKNCYKAPKKSDVH